MVDLKPRRSLQLKALIWGQSLQRSRRVCSSSSPGSAANAGNDWREHIFNYFSTEMSLEETLDAQSSPFTKETWRPKTQNDKISVYSLCFCPKLHKYTKLLLILINISLIQSIKFTFYNILLFNCLISKNSSNTTNYSWFISTLLQIQFRDVKIHKLLLWNLISIYGKLA